MSRQFLNVSISPWRINPYTGTSLDTTNNYNAAAPQQPQYAYSRAVQPPTQDNYYYQVPRVITEDNGEEGEDDDDVVVVEEAGMLGQSSIIGSVD